MRGAGDGRATGGPRDIQAAGCGRKRAKCSPARSGYHPRVLQAGTARSRGCRPGSRQSDIPETEREVLVPRVALPRSTPTGSDAAIDGDELSSRGQSRVPSRRELAHRGNPSPWNSRRAGSSAAYGCRPGATARSADRHADGCLQSPRKSPDGKSGNLQWLGPKILRRTETRAPASTAAPTPPLPPDALDHHSGPQRRPVFPGARAARSPSATTARSRRPSRPCATRAPSRHPNPAQTRPGRPGRDRHTPGWGRSPISPATSPAPTAPTISSARATSAFQVLEFLDRLAVPRRARPAHPRAGEAPPEIEARFRTSKGRRQKAVSALPADTRRR